MQKWDKQMLLRNAMDECVISYGKFQPSGISEHHVIWPGYGWRGGPEARYSMCPPSNMATPSLPVKTSNKAKTKQSKKMKKKMIQETAKM
jgi:hypothetical protein